MSLPVIPDHTITKGTGIAVMIDAIQVGKVTKGVPPGSVIDTGAVAMLIVIIILILCGKLMIMVNSERVISSS